MVILLWHGRPDGPEIKGATSSVANRDAALGQMAWYRHEMNAFGTPWFVRLCLSASNLLSGFGFACLHPISFPAYSFFPHSFIGASACRVGPRILTVYLSGNPT
jgi:hypothetical protein